MSERYAITVSQDGTVVREAETGEACWTYAADDRLADLGALDAAFTLRVAQVSPTLGAGHGTEASHGA